jgi:ATP phosphoribosyltransferase
LVVNRASMKMKHGKLNPIIEQMAAAVERRRQG